MISNEALTSLIQLHVRIKSDMRKEEIMKKKHARFTINMDFGRFDGCRR